LQQTCRIGPLDYRSFETVGWAKFSRVVDERRSSAKERKMQIWRSRTVLGSPIQRS
jgi:hypothetical protein